MRLVILTDGEDRHFHFVNTLISRTGLAVAVFLGAKKVKRSRKEEWQRLARRGEICRYLKKRVLDKVYTRAQQVLKQERLAAENEAFGRAKETFYRDHAAALAVHDLSSWRSLNDPGAVALIRDSRPDLIAVMGTALVGKAILALCPHVINMHTGLSPYYRGGQTNFWPFVTGGHGQFGVTIHKMSLGIDSGDIYATERIILRAGDSYPAINARAIMRGSELMAQTILKFAEGGNPRAVPQWMPGLQFNKVDYHGAWVQRYLDQRDQFIAEELRREENGEFSAIRTVSLDA